MASGNLIILLLRSNTMQATKKCHFFFTETLMLDSLDFISSELLGSVYCFSISIATCCFFKKLHYSHTVDFCLGDPDKVFNFLVELQTKST